MPVDGQASGRCRLVGIGGIAAARRKSAEAINSGSAEAVVREWAVEDARFRIVLRPRSGDDEAMTHDGRTTVLWRRLEPGEWRIDRCIDRSEASPRT